MEFFIMQTFKIPSTARDHHFHHLWMGGIEYGWRRGGAMCQSPSRGHEILNSRRVDAMSSFYAVLTQELSKVSSAGVQGEVGALILS